MAYWDCKLFLVKYNKDEDYDMQEFNRDSLLDIISEEAGSWRFSDGWKYDTETEIEHMRIGEEITIYGQYAQWETPVFIVKRIK